MRARNRLQRSCRSFVLHIIMPSLCDALSFGWMRRHEYECASVIGSGYRINGVRLQIRHLATAWNSAGIASAAGSGLTTTIEQLQHFRKSRICTMMKLRFANETRVRLAKENLEETTGETNSKSTTAGVRARSIDQSEWKVGSSSSAREAGRAGEFCADEEE